MQQIIADQQSITAKRATAECGELAEISQYETFVQVHNRTGAARRGVECNLKPHSSSMAKVVLNHTTMHSAWLGFDKQIYATVEAIVVVCMHKQFN